MRSTLVVLTTVTILLIDTRARPVVASLSVTYV